MKKNADTGQGNASDGKLNHVRLSPPWRAAEFQGLSGVSDFYHESARAFIAERTRVHALYIREEARTKRLTVIISAVFLLVAIAVILFAPDGREIRSFLLSGVLLIFAAGTFGYKRVYGKTKIGSLGADTEMPPVPNKDAEYSKE